MYIHGGAESKQVIYHPNQYFDESIEIVAPKELQVSSTKKRKQPGNDSISEKKNNETQNTQETVDSAMFDDDVDFSGIV